MQIGIFIEQIENTIYKTIVLHMSLAVYLEE